MPVNPDGTYTFSQRCCPAVLDERCAFCDGRAISHRRTHPHNCRDKASRDKIIPGWDVTYFTNVIDESFED